MPDRHDTPPAFPNPWLLLVLKVIGMFNFFKFEFEFERNYVFGSDELCSWFLQRVQINQSEPSGRLLSQSCATTNQS